MGGGTREMWGHWVPRHTEDMPLPRAGQPPVLPILLPVPMGQHTPASAPTNQLPDGHVDAGPRAHGPTAAALSSQHCLQASVSVPYVKNGGNNIKRDKHLTSLRPRSR